MSIKALEGTRYGPFRVRIGAEQVAAYVAATGDDSTRWVEHAPPTFASALLFAAAPAFLGADQVRPYTRLLVHADQAFTWHRALEVGERVVVDGMLTRIRERGGVSFVTFECAVKSDSASVIDAVSTFIMGDGAPSQTADEEQEPPVGDRAGHDALPGGADLTPGPLTGMTRSASRLDLVRYAAASGDFNPIHFDHETAVRAGFPGVLVHGLLMGAWLVQFAAAHVPSPDGVESAKLRFRNALRPAVAARVEGEVTKVVEDRARLRLILRDGSAEYVDARIGVRMK